MSFLDGITKKISETAKVAAKKSTDIVDITKISKQIDKEQKEIEDKILEIGKNVVEKHAEDKWVLENFGDKISEIKASEEKIAGWRKEINKLKNILLCEACGAELDKEAVFCPKCGAKCKDEAKTE